MDEILKCDRLNESYIEQYFTVVLLPCSTRWFYLLSVWIKSSSVTIQMKATEQYFPVVLFIMLYRWFYLLGLWIKSSSVTIQMEASDCHFPVVLFVMLYKVVLIFVSNG